MVHTSQIAFPIARTQVAAKVIGDATDLSDPVSLRAISSRMMEEVEPDPNRPETYPTAGGLAIIGIMNEAIHSVITAQEKDLDSEAIRLGLMMENPAITPYWSLFARDDDEMIAAQAIQTEKGLGRQITIDGMTLFEFLRLPFKAHPVSLEGQLNLVIDRWGQFLSDDMKQRSLFALDMLSEELKARIGGPGPALVPGFGDSDLYPEHEAFSSDLDWMPNLVMIAKSTHVWLWQLSQRYGWEIRTLDQVPDCELDKLSRWGITGLWLIGLWERSPASRTIKQWRGNPEALASAYSIYDYEIASDLGGREAMEDLKARAWKRGIRIGADMVPNHMGLSSKWTVDHPERFIQRPDAPFPAYSFSGQNLSHDDRVMIQVEDHYFDESDAAVVFKHTDTDTGQVRYIYHGNDGTSIPWNDTAQLDFLKPEVRAAVIQEIVKVARDFPIIRFDAAMTLAKKHFQRLWYPSPGSGGDIPSRSEFSLDQGEFDFKFPQEFWREVVDRIAVEAPDTLLLAEAFWLMEGYFVRTLGMHRVYNSAFMNMLKTEDNADFRSVIKNVLEFDPRILKRFVNFMNNPDEDSAVEQFGKGPKYTGVAVLMSTLPGLPMFGHGQIEGLTEKYGMEYSRAYFDEEPDQELVGIHERFIFPLVRARWLFSEADNFRLYDMFTDSGDVNEDVISFSNRAGDKAALVVYNNRASQANGWVRTSCAFKDLGSDELVQKDLFSGLGLDAPSESCISYRDRISGMEYLISSEELRTSGIKFDLDNYEVRVLLDWQVREGTEWTVLSSRLDGRGVPSLEDELVDMEYDDILGPLEKVLKDDPSDEDLESFAQACAERLGVEAEAKEVLQGRLALADQLVTKFTARVQAQEGKDGHLIEKLKKGGTVHLAYLHGWALVPRDADGVRLQEAYSSLRIDRGVHKALVTEGRSEQDAKDMASRLAVHERIGMILEADPVGWFKTLIEDETGAELVGCNEFEGTRYINEEGFSNLLETMYMLDTLDILSFKPTTDKEKMEQLLVVAAREKQIRVVCEKAGWRVDEVLAWEPPVEKVQMKGCRSD